MPRGGPSESGAGCRPYWGSTSEKRQTGDRAEGLRVGSAALLHSEDDGDNNRMSVPLRQQLCVSAVRGPREQIGHCEVPTAAECHLAPSFRIRGQENNSRCGGRARCKQQQFEHAGSGRWEMRQDGVSS